MGQDKDSLSSLKEIIERMFREGGLGFNVDDARIWKVAVSDPIWMQELKFVEENVREKLNRRLGREAVQKVEFRLRH